MRYLISFLVFSAFLFFSINSQNLLIPENIKEGLNVEYDDLGRFKKIFSCKNGLLNGWFAEFDSNGYLKKEELYINGINSGIGYEYENGVLRRKMKWLNSNKDNKHFEETVYDLYSGLKRSEGFWKNNIKDSIWRHYDERESLKAIERYSGGKRNGYQEKYYPNQKLAEKTFFSDGMFNGSRLLLTDNGDTTEYGVYFQNKRNGFFILYEPIRIKDLSQDEKSFRIESNYSLGKLNGSVLIKYLSGIVAAEEYYNQDKLDRKRTLYHENGVVAFTAHYVAGIKNGLETRYYNNGNVQCKSTYSDGKLTGEQSYYFEDGKMSEVFEFKNGELLSLKRFYPSSKLKERIEYKNGKIQIKDFYTEDGKRILKK